MLCASPPSESFQHYISSALMLLVRQSHRPQVKLYLQRSVEENARVNRGSEAQVTVATSLNCFGTFETIVRIQGMMEGYIANVRLPTERRRTQPCHGRNAWAATRCGGWCSATLAILYTHEASWHTLASCVHISRRANPLLLQRKSSMWPVQH
jgi:hypothetical protein